jgi:hypothetical protein
VLLACLTFSYQDLNVKLLEKPWPPATVVFITGAFAPLSAGQKSRPILAARKGILLNPDAMSFLTKEYDVYVILAGPRTLRPWAWGRWQTISTAFEPFANSPIGNASVRTTQVQGNARKKVPFGKLTWDKKSSEKWAHGSPTNEAASNEWRFLSAEAWSPSWTQCEKDKNPPNFFLSLRNVDPPEQSHFSAVILVALSITNSESKLLGFRQATRVTATRLESPLTVWKTRTWAKPYGTMAITDALNDIAFAGLFKVGNPHKRPLDIATFTEEWTQLE